LFKSKLLKREKASSIKLPKKAGIKIRFARDTALNPILFIMAVGMQNSSIMNTIGVLLKYISFNEFEKYLIIVVVVIRKNSIYKIPTTIFNGLPPRYSDISKMSLFLNGSWNLHIIRQNDMVIILIYIVFNKMLLPVCFRRVLGKFNMRPLVTTITIRAVASSLPILLFESIFVNSFFHNLIYIIFCFFVYVLEESV
jgi:hypothetical protein